MPAAPGHYAFSYLLVEKRDVNTAVLMLDYTLTDEESYPRQLIQAVDILRYAITSLGKHPSNIILAGDSSGGNLVLGLISHLSHPHPSISPFELSAPLKGMVLISPWASFDVSLKSYSVNKYKDLVDSSSVQAWSDAYVASAALDAYNAPDKAPVGWWKGMKVCNVLITGGADERMIDAIRDVGETIKVRSFVSSPRKYHIPPPEYFLIPSTSFTMHADRSNLHQAAHPKTTLFIAEKEFHVQPILSYTFSLEEGEQARVVKAWVRQML